MNVVVKKNDSSMTFEELNIGDIFTWRDIDLERLKDYTFLKMSNLHALNLISNEVGAVGGNFEYYSKVKRIKSHLVVEGFEE